MSWPLPTMPGRPASAMPQTGFTLVEVLVAVAIVAIALAAGGRAAGALLDNSQRLADVTAAQWCADNLLSNQKLARHFPDVGESQGECQQLAQRYRTTMRVQVTPNPNFRRVDVMVANEQGPSLLTLSTVLPRY